MNTGGSRLYDGSPSTQESALRRRATVQRAADCAAVGVLFFVFSLPIATAGAAWAACAEIFAAWVRDDEPPLCRTFLRVLRRDLLSGFLALLAVMSIVAIGYFDVRLALAERIPGFGVEAAAVCVVGAVCLAIMLIAFAHRAVTSQTWTESVRAAIRLSRRRPWAPTIVVAAVAVAASLVAAVPAFVVLIAGPTSFAVAVVHARACGETGLSGRVPDEATGAR
jgi:uncharacterized membrane protein YesL